MFYSFKRPVYIAVYGHPSHEVNHYTLDVVYEPSSHDLFYEEVNTGNIVVEEEEDGRQGFTEDKNYEGRQVILIFYIYLVLVVSLLSFSILIVCNQ